MLETPPPTGRALADALGDREVSEETVAALRLTLDASPDLRVLLGLDPPPQPAPGSPCAICGCGALPGRPLRDYLDGRRRHDHCPQPRLRAKLSKGERR